MSNNATDLVAPPLEAGQPAAQGFDLILLDLAAFCFEAEVLSVVALNSTTVRVTFERDVLDNVVLRFALAYELAEADTEDEPIPGGHAPLVLDVNPEQAVTPIFVDLTTEEMRDGLRYRLLINRLETVGT